MSEDIQGGAVPPRRKRPPEDDDYEPDSEYLLAPPFPGTVTAAGVIWIAFGCLVLLHLAVAVLVTIVFAAALPGAAGGAFFAGGICVLVFIGLIGAAFLFVGIQSVRGTARDTLGNGVGSILFAVMIGCYATVLFAGPNSVAAGIGALEAAILLAAGVLALAGGNQYKLWRRAKKNQRERKREERRERMEP